MKILKRSKFNIIIQEYINFYIYLIYFSAKCITFITFLIMIVWLLEVITFYSPGNEDSLAFLEILNGLQGMFILIIFMAIRSKRVIITHWWYDRGSAVITPLHNSK